MKIALDENLPRRIVSVLKTLDEGSEFDSCEIVTPRHYSLKPRAGDKPWIMQFAEDGGDIIVSAEKRMRSNIHEQLAIVQGNLTGFFLPPAMHNWPLHQRAAFLIKWWHRILRHAMKVDRGTLWIVPQNWTTGEFKNVRVKQE